MIHYQSPKFYKKDRYTIFLGGSIDMGNCENWQQKLADDLKDEDVILLNPRSDIFDLTQEQSVKNDYFYNRVNWELDGLLHSDLIVMYLLPNTYSPISLMEIGLYTDINKFPNDKMIICCPDGFWRKGNVEIVCKRYGIKIYDDYFSFFEEIKKRIKLNHNI
jgi:hypothetical protein